MVNRIVVQLAPITAENIDHLRRINGASFPIVYNQAFYKDILNQEVVDLNQFAYYKGKIIGAVCASLECIAPGKQRVYIRTLAVLAVYRGRGVGSQLIGAILQFCSQNASVSEVSLHVQISNQDAIDFYTQKFEFTRGELVENYYRRIDPPHCYLLYKQLRE